MDTRTPAGARPSRGGALVSAAGGVAGLTLLSRALGLARWAVQAAAVGAGTVAGAYSTANQIPNVLYEVVVGGALAATVVPLLAASVSGGRRREVEQTASGLLGIVLVALVPLAVVLALAAEPIAGLFPVSKGVDAGLQVDLVAQFLRMFAIQIPLYGVGVVLTGVLQAHSSFTWPALAPLLSSLTVMATYGLYSAMAPGGGQDPSVAALQVLGWGTTAGVAALSLPLIWPVYRLGLRLKPRLRLDRDTARKALRLGAAGVWTLLAQQLSVLVVLALARSHGNTGTIAVYQYTQAVYLLPYAVLAVPVATVLYPKLTAAFAGGVARDLAAPDLAAGDSAARDLAARATGAVMAVALAGAGMLLAASHGAERFFALLTDEVAGMGQALVFLAPGLVGFVMIYQVTRVLFAIDRAHGAALATASGWAMVAAASWVAVHLASQGGEGAATLRGLAVGQSLGMVCAGVGLFAVLAKFLGASVLLPSLRAIALASPVALAFGLGGRVLSRMAEAPGLSIAIAALGAVLTAVAVVGACHWADRSLLAVLRAPGLAPHPPKKGADHE